MSINNDSDFHQALDGLSLEQQRAVGSLFVKSVLELSDDPRVAQSLQAATVPDIGDEALGFARRTAKAASLDAHARCGADGEWTDQAGYFVARAVEACLEPEGRSGGKGPAWKAAMSARMARTCLAAESEEDSHDVESQAQYRILTNYLGA